MNDKLLKATHGSDKTPLKLGELEIPCYVLEDGTRVFSGRGIQKVLGAESTSGSWLQRFAKNSTIAPRFRAGELSILDRINNPIKFKRPDAGGSQSSTNGYEVTILVDICSEIIEANRAGEFNEEPIVHNAFVILQAVAKVGIIALVDEVTGYQHDRERDALQQILKAYISEALLPWQKRFPDKFYRELFRLNGWDYTVKGIKARPGVIGKWTNTLIYQQLPSGVLNKLKENTPKSSSGNYTARFHQHLTEDIGDPALSAQIQRIITIFEISDSMKQMWQLFEKLKMRQHGQAELPFTFDEQGHTIELPPQPLSSFDTALKKALEFNPRK